MGSLRSFAANHSRLKVQVYLIEYVDKILKMPTAADVCATTTAKSRLHLGRDGPFA
jgi:hypothetical protein